MSGGYLYPACICPADACFKVKQGAYCKHAGMVLARFVDQWGKRFSCYVRPGEYKPGQRTPTGARCTSTGEPDAGAKP